jgi:coenzyme Q-binding protein COQ10
MRQCLRCGADSPQVTRTIIEAERRLPYAPDALCRIVGDVRAYPDFIPWLKRVTVIEETPRPDGGWQGKVEVVVGWKAFTERFKSHVRSEPEKGEVEVTLIKGPLKSLDNLWRFAADGAGGAKVHFRIGYEFKNPLLQAAISANRERLAARIMSAFEAEAKRRLG